MGNTPTTRRIKCGNLDIRWLAPGEKVDETWLRANILTEEAQAADAIRADKRRLDFLRGRWLFHHAHASKTPLLNASTGEPQWPDDIRGSITHKDGHVMLALTDNKWSTGIDLESRHKVGAHLLEKIATTAELKVLQQHLPEDLALTSIFAAKEAVFKAIYPLMGQFFYFHDFICLDYQPEHHKLSGQLNKNLSERFQAGTQIEIHLAFLPQEQPDFVLAGVLIPS